MRHQQPMTGPILFAAILLTFVGLCLVVIARQSGPIVLGTEREADAWGAAVRI